MAIAKTYAEISSMTLAERDVYLQRTPATPAIGKDVAPIAPVPTPTPATASLTRMQKSEVVRQLFNNILAQGKTVHDAFTELNSRGIIEAMRKSEEPPSSPVGEMTQIQKHAKLLALATDAIRTGKAANAMEAITYLMEQPDLMDSLR